MSEERLEELGIPRRRFLKKSAAAAFVAPVVVSFALDGVAEGDTRGSAGTFADQKCANQTFPNQYQVERDLLNVVEGAVYSIPGCELNKTDATNIALLALSAALAAAEDTKDMCKDISTLIHAIKKLPHSGARSEMLYYAKQASLLAGCHKA